MNDRETVQFIDGLQERLNFLEETLDACDNILYASDVSRIQVVIQEIRLKLEILKNDYRGQ